MLSTVLQMLQILKDTEALTRIAQHRCCGVKIWFDPRLGLTIAASILLLLLLCVYAWRITMSWSSGGILVATGRSIQSARTWLDNELLDCVNVHIAYSSSKSILKTTSGGKEDLTLE